MDKRIEEVLDYSLLIAQSYLILRLALSNNSYFKTPFFYFFIITGSLGILSVAVFVTANRFNIPEEFAWIFKTAYMLNTFGVTGSTIGKIFIAAHRYSVLRNVKMQEDVWNDRLKFSLTGILIFVSCCRCVSVLFCGYSFIIKEGVRFVSYIDDECAVVEKSESSVTYFIFIIVSIVLTVQTSRQLYNLQKDANVTIGLLKQTQTKQLIMEQQRNMFIIVTVCTISHLIKAMHQFFWVFAAYFHLTELNAILQATYVYPHYLASYSASLTLVIFSPRVRLLLLTRKEMKERSNAGATAVF